MLIKITAQGIDDWSLDLELPSETTVAKFKQIIAEPPHSIEISNKTKVLWRRANNCLMALLDNEKVKATIVLLNAQPTVLNMTFPAGFVWGSATAAYQIEGAAKLGGRTPSIWDTFAAVPGNIDNGDTAEVACDHYFRYREDIKLMKELGLPAYRFSISWPRLLPKGRGDVNPEAVTFYRSLLEEMVEHKIQPLVTLYHWDLPQCLEDEYNGWRGRQILEDFEAYAAACFSSFGDLVKSWITINEPWCAAVLGYATAEHAPGRKEAPMEEPYLVAHHMILAHARAVKRYRTDFKTKQQGRIGITLNMDWKEPVDASSEADVAAQSRALAWQLGWFADPIYRGNYPVVMRNRCKDRLPIFTEAEQKLVKGSADFFGLNHYSTDFVSPDLKGEPKNFFEDCEVKNTSDPEWSKTGIGWDIVPWGLGRLVAWIHREYAPPGGIVITENGCAVNEETAKGARDDTLRVEYFQGYLSQLHKAIAAGAHVWGYFAWSLMDNFEWAYGYAKRFGLVRVDYETLERSPKASARVFSEAARTNTVRVPTGIAMDSEFVPMGEKKEKAPRPAAKPLIHPNGSEITLSLSQALHLLSDLADRYQDDEFQQSMEAAYRKFEEDGSNLQLSKARQSICLPIQSAVLPKYGFEPNAAGVHKSVMALRSPALVKNEDVTGFVDYVNFLISDLPHARAKADARRQKEQEELDVMEALGMGKPEPEQKEADGKEQAAAEAAADQQASPGAEGAEASQLSPENAKFLLEEFHMAIQDREVQERLVEAWVKMLQGNDLEKLAKTVLPFWVRSWSATTSQPPPADFRSEAWMPPAAEQSTELKHLQRVTRFFWQDLPMRLAKKWVKGGAANKTMQQIRAVMKSAVEEPKP